MSGNNARFATRAIVTRTNLSSVPTLLKQLLDHPGGHPKPLSNLLSGSFAPVVRCQNSFP